jgi:hypothetical protein
VGLGFGFVAEEEDDETDEAVDGGMDIPGGGAATASGSSISSNGRSGNCSWKGETGTPANPFGTAVFADVSVAGSAGINESEAAAPSGSKTKSGDEVPTTGEPEATPTGLTVFFVPVAAASVDATPVDVLEEDSPAPLVGTPTGFEAPAAVAPVRLAPPAAAWPAVAAILVLDLPAAAVVAATDAALTLVAGIPRAAATALAAEPSLPAPIKEDDVPKPAAAGLPRAAALVAAPLRAAPAATPSRASRVEAAPLAAPSRASRVEARPAAAPSRALRVEARPAGAPSRALRVEARPAGAPSRALRVEATSKPPPAVPPPRAEVSGPLVPSTRVGAPGAEAPSNTSGSSNSADPISVGTSAESGRASGTTASTPRSNKAPCESRSSSDSTVRFAGEAAVAAGFDGGVAVEAARPDADAAPAVAMASSTGRSAKGSKAGRDAASIVFEPEIGAINPERILQCRCRATYVMAHRSGELP